MRLESEDYLGAETCFDCSLDLESKWPEKEIPFEYAES